MFIAVSVDAIHVYLESQISDTNQRESSDYGEALLEVIRDYIQVLLSKDCNRMDLLRELQRSLADVGYPHYALSKLNETLHACCVELLTTYVPSTATEVSYVNYDKIGRRIILQVR